MSLKKVAVIANRVKIGNQQRFRRLVNHYASNAGFAEPKFFFTSASDPGFEAASNAKKFNADLVLVAGGDGTVRIVCQEFAHSNIAIGLLPSGTGNLLARNLRIPLDLRSAAELAFSGKARGVDAIQVQADGQPPALSMGICGVGFDAKLMEATDENLKKAVGNTAYLAAFMKIINAPLRTLSYKIDDSAPTTRKAALFLVCNIGSLQAGITLLKDADPSDGLLDLVVASPKGIAGWAKLLRRVLHRCEAIQTHIGKQINVTLPISAPYELDGDLQGLAQNISFKILPGALQIVQPN